MNFTPSQWLPFFPVYFAACWLLVTWILSRMGWHSFANRYPAINRPQGKSFACPYARFGSVFASYRNIMRLVFSDTGIYVYPLFLFRPFHRPFLVPWDHVVGVKKVKGLFGNRYQLEVRDSFGAMHAELSEAGALAFEKQHPV